MNRDMAIKIALDMVRMKRAAARGTRTSAQFADSKETRLREERNAALLDEEADAIEFLLNRWIERDQKQGGAQ